MRGTGKVNIWRQQQHALKLLRDDPVMIELAKLKPPKKGKRRQYKMSWVDREIAKINAQKRRDKLKARLTANQSTTEE